MLSGRSPAAASSARSRTSSRSASARSARNVGCEPEIEQPWPKANATSVRDMKPRYSRRASATVMGRYTRRRDRRGQAGLVARLLLVRWSDGRVCPRLRRRGDSGSRERLAFEQRRARQQAGTRYLGADRAVAMVLGVSIALLGTRGARPDTRREQIADGEEVPLRGSRKNPRRGVADVGADQIERDTGAQRGDVRLDEIGVCARRAGLDAGQAGVDRGGELRRPDRNTRGRASSIWRV